MTIDLQIGDNREILPNYPDSHFDCIVTSPPYWGLRNYETPPLIFDGDPNCEHEWDTEIIINRGHQGDKTTLVGTQTANISKSANNFGSFCSKCSAWKGQLGLEPTPELFIKHLVDTFDIVKSKLKNTGTCFVNIGDTYSVNRGRQVDGNKQVNGSQPSVGMSILNCGVPEKCLCMIPERFAWEMIERDWVLRNKIVWKKINPMPESVTDRFSKTYEMVYFFTKGGKYNFDLDAVREPHTTQENRPPGIVRSREWGYEGKYRGNAMRTSLDLSDTDSGDKHSLNELRTTRGLHVGRRDQCFNDKGKNPGDYLETSIDELTNTELKLELLNMMNQWKEMHPDDWNLPRDVWKISTQPYSEAHFAVFPIELVRKPILAGCPINGWVLDPFAGSGTVGEFCNDNHRNVVLIELNEEYRPLIVDRANLKQISLSKIFSYIK